MIKKKHSKNKTNDLELQSKDVLTFSVKSNFYSYSNYPYIVKVITKGGYISQQKELNRLVLVRYPFLMKLKSQRATKQQ
ncbi:hypothetical protein FPKKA176_contig00011-0016 [Flavobacterium psychrophilum]|nr:hypothetical protein FPKKA176_contig00011-0016 [Flavobacterium psychrophilum]